MSVVESDIQWFIARDGKQHGPLSDAEMRKLVELRHLRSTDLVWRLGFSDWRPAVSTFPALAEPAPTPQPTVAARPEETPKTGPAPFPQPSRFAPSPQEAVRTEQTGAPRSALGSTLGSPAYRGPQANPQQGTQPSMMGAPGPSNGRRQHAPAPVADYPAKKSGRGGRLVFTTFLLALIGSGGWYGLKHKELVLELLRSRGGAEAPGANASAEQPADTTPTTQSSTLGAAAVVAPAATTATFNSGMLQRPVWLAVKQEFPEWYDARTAEVAKLTSEGKSEDEVTRHIVEALVALRRENSKLALAASTAKHRELATAFLGNLKQLAAESSDGCYEFISKGENSSAIVTNMQSPEKSGNIDAQVSAIVSAISEGRKSPVTHASPVKADYDMLAGQLGKLGWTQADMQLFADPKALARAPRDRVCKMLQDWFTAHLAIPDPAVQERLLFETLKPVISG